MSRQLSVAVENNFSKGLITEATALNFPESACTETFDCVFHRTGEVTRRLGIDLEDAFDSFENDFTGKAVTEYLWESVGQNGDVVMFVLQVGTTISFFGLDSVGSLSPSIKSFEVDLADYAAPGASSTEIQEDHAQFCSGYGMLWITHPHTDPIQVEYDSEEDDVTKTKLTLRVRDVDGVPNNSALTGIPLEFNIRPTRSQVSEVILYNLYNQGWSVKTACTTDGKHWDKNLHPLVMWTGGYDFTIPLFGPTYSRTDWPSEGDAWWSMKATILPGIDGDGNAVPPIPPPDGFSLQGVDKIGQPMAPAGKGHFLLNAFAEDRVAAVNTDVNTPYPLDGTSWNRTGNLGVAFYDRNAGKNRPATCAFHAGRIFYAGVSHEKYTGDIFFSQIMERNRNAERCYQHNDPTNEGVTDLLPNDGGIVRIPLMARCVKLISVGANLIAFATNGVWRIGSAVEASGGFSANDYTVSRLSDVGCISPLSFVKTDRGIMWWNHDGLWTLTQDPTAGIQVVNLALSTIQTYIDDLPSTEFRWVKGAFNPVSKIVQWLHRTTASDTVEERYEYNRILNLDTVTGAFYPWTIPDTCMKVVGVDCIKGVGEEISQENVVDNDGVDVTDLSGEVVTIDVTTQTDLSSRFKYVTKNLCEALEPLPPDEEEGIDFDANLVGDFNISEVTAYASLSPPGAMIYGEDGVLYLAPQEGSELLRYDGTDTTITPTRAQLITDVDSVTHLLASGYSNGVGAGMWIIPYPGTAYFMVVSHMEKTFPTYALIFGLYKINSSGNAEFVNAYVHDEGWTVALGSKQTRTVGYEGTDFDDLLDAPLLISMAVTGSLGDIYGPIVRFPSVNEFIAITGSGFFETSAWSTTWVTGSNVTGFRGTNTMPATNSCFLPYGNTMLWVLNVDKGQCDTYNSSIGGILNHEESEDFAVANPNGYISAWNFDTQSWSLVHDTLFSEVFDDTGNNLDGSSGDRIYNRWTGPTVQYDLDNDLQLLTWMRSFEPTEANQAPLGFYNKVAIYFWNSDTNTMTLSDEAEGPTVDTVTYYGVGAGSRYGFYPLNSWAWLAPNLEDIYGFYGKLSLLDAYARHFTVLQIGTFTVPEIVSIPVSLMFSEYNNTNYTDWEQSLGGEDYISHFTTGYKLRGEGIRKWQDNYLSIFSKPDDVHDTSVFDIHAKWDYANTGDTGRWSVTQRVTTDDTGYDYGIKRLKVRGHGKAMQFKVASVDTEPFSIIGWASWDSANAKP